MTAASPDLRSASVALSLVRDLWQARACGEVYAQGDSLRDQLEAQARACYELEPYLRRFARFEDGSGRDVHLESPGSKAYAPDEAREMFSAFSGVVVHSELSPGDVLLGAAGQRHRGLLLDAARQIYPRGAARRFLGGLGLHLLIEATRPGHEGSPA